MENSVVTFESSKTGWNKAYESLKGTHPQCIAFDSSNPNHAYCGTFGGGLWKTREVVRLFKERPNENLIQLCDKHLQKLTILLDGCEQLFNSSK
ncbi:MAG TPA: hypothetical protein VFJ05_02425 [Nitrososphaeraceae archaeon]|nr:hypothetical protein [Nitrososphaeraceae archaeon]